MSRKLANKKVQKSDFTIYDISININFSVKGKPMPIAKLTGLIFQGIATNTKLISDGYLDAMFTEAELLRDQYFRTCHNPVKRIFYLLVADLDLAGGFIKMVAEDVCVETANLINAMVCALYFVNGMDERAKNLADEFSMDGLSLVLAQNLRVVEWPKSAERFFGFTRAAVSNRKIFDTFVPKFDSRGRDLSEELHFLEVNHPVSRILNVNENQLYDGKRIFCLWINLAEYRNHRLHRVRCYGVRCSFPKTAKMLVGLVTVYFHWLNLKKLILP